MNEIIPPAGDIPVGAVGSPYFRYYDHRIAEAITSSGQLAIQSVLKYYSQEGKPDRLAVLLEEADTISNLRND
jgi:hypothetical protein